jgi:hypothetical protein
MSDLVCYFFEKARAQIESGKTKRAGLLATNSIRGGASRKVLERIKETGDVFMAWDDEPWILEGAAVRIAIVGFDDGSESSRYLDGRSVGTINSGTQKAHPDQPLQHPPRLARLRPRRPRPRRLGRLRLGGRLERDDGRGDIGAAIGSEWGAGYTI